MTAHPEPPNSPGCWAVGALVIVVLCQLPAFGIYHYWLFRGRSMDGQSIHGAGLIGFLAPPFLLLGWLVAIPLLMLSPWARRNIVLWIALAFGVIGQVMYGAVIGYF